MSENLNCDSVSQSLSEIKEYRACFAAKNKGDLREGKDYIHVTIVDDDG